MTESNFTQPTLPVLQLVALPNATLPSSENIVSDIKIGISTYVEVVLKIQFPTL